MVEEDREIWDLTEPKRVEWDSRAAWSRIEKKLDGRRSIGGPRQSFEVLMPKAASRTRVFALAATLVLAVGSVAGYEVMQRRAESERLALAAKPVPMNEVVTRRAQRAAIQLVDGTKITLNVDSRLRYAQSYGSANRVVELEGEAFFEVAHMDSLPFVVRTSHAAVRDISTRFVVSAYAAQSETRVVVADGAVVLAVPSDSVTLSGSTLGVASAGKLQTTSDVDVTDHVAWTEGRLVFVGAPLGEVVQRLSRWYDIDVRLADAKLADVRFSGTFRSENPEYVLRLMAASAGARLRRSGAAWVVSR